MFFWNPVRTHPVNVLLPVHSVLLYKFCYFWDMPYKG